MLRSEHSILGAFSLAVLFFAGCGSINFVGVPSVNYVGQSFKPTASVAVYFDKEEINKEFAVIGHAVGSMIGRSSEEIQQKLIETAKLEGADAILITGVGKAQVGKFNSTETQINASFLKYK